MDLFILKYLLFSLNEPTKKFISIYIYIYIYVVSHINKYTWEFFK